MVRQRSAKPRTAVRICYRPQKRAFNRLFGSALKALRLFREADDLKKALFTGPPDTLPACSERPSAGRSVSCNRASDSPSIAVCIRIRSRGSWFVPVKFCMIKGGHPAIRFRLGGVRLSARGGESWSEDKDGAKYGYPIESTPSPDRGATTPTGSGIYGRLSKEWTPGV